MMSYWLLLYGGLLLYSELLLYGGLLLYSELLVTVIWWVTGYCYMVSYWSLLSVSYWSLLSG